jgi:ribosomal protein S18 acetylase RimI-like enzyme
MNIRKAALTDADAIFELGRSVSEFAVNNETVNFWPKELLAHAIQSDDVLILVAEDEAVIGFIIVNHNHGLKKALIENIYVLPDRRGQGVGAKLMKQMLELLPEMGCQYVVTLVPPNAQDAINLYRHSGFSEGETFVWFDKAIDNGFKK